MSTLAEWQKATQSLYQQTPESIGFEALTGVKQTALAVESKVLQLPPRHCSHFYNIAGQQDDLFDKEFIEEHGAGCLVRDLSRLDANARSVFLYCHPSITLSDSKRDLLSSDHETKADLGIDPLSLGLWKSELLKLKIKNQQVKEAIEKKITMFRISAQAYALAGAPANYQIAILLASIVELMDDYENEISQHEIAQTLSLEVAMTPNIVSGVCQLQALRLLVEFLFQKYDVEQNSLPIWCAPSLRYLVSREPWNNILKLSTMNQAALQGGASGFVNLPYDLYSKNTQWRVSRNINLILQKESYLGKVHDPSLGSHSLNGVVHDLCEGSWNFFQEIMKKGGMRSALRSGWLQGEIERENLQEQASFLGLKIKMTGVNDYPLIAPVSETYPLTPASEVRGLEEYWADYVCIDDAEARCNVERLIPTQLSSLFENWQFRGDQLRKDQGSPLGVSLWVEAGFEKNKKLRKLQNTLALGGLDAHICRHDSEPTRVNIIVATEPEGEYAKGCVQRIRKKSQNLCLWAGEKDFSQYDFSVGGQTDLKKLYSQIYKALEGGQ